MVRVRTATAAAAAAMATALVLGGCAGGPTTSRTAAGTDLPSGVTLSVYQTRTDLGQHKLEVAFTNDSGGALGITRMVFRSEQFVEPAVWAKDATTIRAGTTVDLPVVLPDPDCAAVDPVHRVEFDYELADGTRGTAVAEPVDRLDRLPALMAEDCISVAVGEVAAITADTVPRVVPRGGQPVAEVDLTIVPSGSDGTVTIGSLASTTLLTPADAATGASLTDATIDRTIAGTDAPGTLTLLLVPNRCDPHAVAEDKRGTFLPLTVVTDDGTEGRLYVRAADAVRTALYDFVQTTCGYV